MDFQNLFAAHSNNDLAKAAFLLMRLPHQKKPVTEQSWYAVGVALLLDLKIKNEDITHLSCFVEAAKDFGIAVQQEKIEWLPFDMIKRLYKIDSEKVLEIIVDETIKSALKGLK